MISWLRTVRWVIKPLILDLMQSRLTQPPVQLGSTAVDCIGSGETICKKHGIKSFPTIRTFQPDTFMQFSGLEYKGGKGIDSLRLHANKLVPSRAKDLETMKAAAAAEAKRLEAKRSAASNKARMISGMKPTQRVLVRAAPSP